MLRIALTLLFTLFVGVSHAVEFKGRILDHKTSEPLAARIYLTDQEGQELFVESADPDGTAVIYREQWVPMEGSSEKHTTVSAHPFKTNLKPGKYQLTIERGKEYFPFETTIEIGDAPVEKTIKLKRWIDLASRGWYSGETHVHRHFEELPNVVQAEDLNVAFPVSYWTTSSLAAPSLNPPNLARGKRSPYGPRKDHGADPIFLDRKHVILPRNTEYEIFSVGETRHTLGAIFLLNHQSVFELKAPPIAEIARKAHAEGALLDLDKHSWPWSMMLVPVAKVDLFELSNNHVWRTNFGFKSYQLMPADWMDVEYEEPGTKMTEWGWLNYGWEVYYALLNCGFRLAPTAGTASGVHPVPLGWSRVYVHTGDHLTVDGFLDGLRRGRSFVTTGPMLFAKVNGKLPGEVFSYDAQESRNFEFEIETVSAKGLSAVEVLVNGKVVERFKPQPEKTAEGALKSNISGTVQLDDSGWITVRAIEVQADGRKRFAHTGCWHVEMANRPVIPRTEQVDWLIGLMKEQIERNRQVLSDEALGEFEQALKIYQKIRQRAKNDEVTIRLEEPPKTTQPVKKPTRLPVGTQAPELAVMEWSDGKQRTLADYRGKVVVLEFWATWCLPCIDSVPIYQKLADKYKNKGVVFLGVHVAGTELDQINKLRKVKKWETPSAIDGGIGNNAGSTCQEYGIKSIPAVMILDREGKIGFNSEIEPENLEAFQAEVAKFAGIPWPPSEDLSAEEQLAQTTLLYYALLSREIERALSVEK